MFIRNLSNNSLHYTYNSRKTLPLLNSDLFRKAKHLVVFFPFFKYFNSKKTELPKPRKNGKHINVAQIDLQRQQYILNSSN